MPKANAFDFTNKKNTGASLGQFIADKLEKEAKKQAAKVRKTSLSSAGGGTSGHDIGHGHCIDLRLPRRELGDVGFSVLAGGLKSALTAADEETGRTYLGLTDLDLSRNNLTAASLAGLTAVLQHARRTIRTLILAENHISVLEDEGAENWDAFLRVFVGCLELKRVDFTGNPLGGRAVEALARAHVCEAGKSAGCSGIRSVASLALNNIGLDDSGALWMSYVLEDRSMAGTEWSQDVTSLSKESIALLRKAETIIPHLEGDNVTEEDDEGQRSEEWLTAPSHHSQNRRASIRSATGSDTGDVQVTELDSLRKRIQRHIIMHDKPTSVDLWRAALRLLHWTRMLLVLAPTTRHYYVPDVQALLPSPVSEAPVICEPPSSSTPKSKDHSKRRPMDVGRAEVGYRTSKAIHASYLPKLGGGVFGQPELAITDVTNTPSTPRMGFKLHRKDAFSEGAGPNLVIERLQGLALRHLGAQHFVRWQQDHIASSGGRMTFRDKSNPCHLPQHLVERAAGYLSGTKAIELLSVRQREAVVAWGFDRKSLAKEQEWKKKDDSSQIWMLLNSVRCLEYGQ